MKQHHYEVIIRTSHEMMAMPGISLQELSRLCDCQIPILRRLVEIGLLEPINIGTSPQFSSAAVFRTRKALRLKRDLNLNFEAVALVMELLDRIDELERTMTNLRKPG